MIDVSALPPSKEELVEMRKSIKTEDTIAFKFLMFNPIPLLDIAMSSVLAIIENNILLGRYSPTVPYDVCDWSQSSAAENYVQKVKNQGRLLAKIEVKALKKQVAIDMKFYQKLRMLDKKCGLAK